MRKYRHKHPLWIVWANMRSRCNNPNVRSFKNYGARGIKICERWNKFKSFEVDMMNEYEKGLTLERIDNDGNYCPENCIWIKKAEQQLNTTRNIFVTFNGRTKILKDWARELNKNYGVLYWRINKKRWSIEEAFRKPCKVFTK